LIANTAPTPKAVALVLIPALVLMLAFAFSYVGAFHEPVAHREAMGSYTERRGNSHRALLLNRRGHLVATSPGPALRGKQGATHRL
jgi:hypothetical protein